MKEHSIKAQNHLGMKFQRGTLNAKAIFYRQQGVG